MESQEPTMPLDQFLEKFSKDNNEWWRLREGDRLNLFEEALDMIAFLLRVINGEVNDIN